jgi:gas vesicle protein
MPTEERELKTIPTGGAEIGETPHARGGFVAGLLFGVFLGAGLALFLAPDRGEKTRRRLRRRMQMLREGARDSLDEAGSRTKKELHRRKRRLRAELERIREKAKTKAREARESLE